MDTHTQTIAVTNQFMHPAQLWVGSPDILIPQVHQYLQKLWCRFNGCGTCITCTQIIHHQHHQLLWITPEKGYTLELIDLIAENMRFTLERHESHVIVLAQADTLNLACSNRLLKALEEPAEGYHFLLLAHRTDMILPTIKSRCIVREWDNTSHTLTHQKLCEYLTVKKAPNPVEFLGFIESTPISEYQSLHVLDMLIVHWAAVHKKALIKQDLHTHLQSTKALLHLQHGLKHPPMPGSTKLFWKNLFLQMYG